MNKISFLTLLLISCVVLIETIQSAPTPQDDKARCEFFCLLFVAIAMELFSLVTDNFHFKKARLCFIKLF